ncbi:MAG: DHHA1 domain-containing protein [Sedimentibacter sp.]|uniref:alanyl-tRNA editing protein n=1 Tax=Sedimentibacter sp. TaxID=1960295 RepID=UPI0031598D79
MKTSEKIYQVDSYMTHLQSEVISCVKEGDHYEVILDKTIFYPHMSGGQPKDEGTINGLAVFDVEERGEEIVHKLREPVSGRVNLSIDFPRRFDHMQQHTGQHILSYALSRLFDGNTVGFHLSGSYTTIDLDINLSNGMAEQAELLSNMIIYENKSVTSREYPYEEAVALDLRKCPPKLDFLRIISIEGYDYSACGGTHVRSTGEIGIIKITKTEKYKQGTRVEFLCGKRALADYAAKNNNIASLSSLLTCRTDMLMENFEKVLNRNKQMEKEQNILKSQLNDYKAKELKMNSQLKDNIRYVFAKTEDDVKDLRSICSRITEENDFVAVLVSEAGGTCSVVIGQSKNLCFDIKNVFEKLKVIINGKGGGNNFLLQCSGDILKGGECIMTAGKMLLNR